MGLGIIAQSFNDTIASASSVFTTGSLRTGASKHYEGVTNRIKVRNWKLSLPYSFQVVGVDSPLSGIAGSFSSGLQAVLGPSSGGGLFDEFYLPINPSEITQDELFSISITPTQRGIVSEHQGVIFKDLVINGTTGMRPTNSKSGYEYFHELRNYFRAYAELKKDPEQKNAQLVFKNRKDNEFLIVEPMKFSMKRRSFLYDYSIILKVVGMRGPVIAGGFLGEIFSTIDGYIDLVTDFALTGRRIFNNFIDTVRVTEQEFVGAILEPIEAYTLAIKSAYGLPLTIADVPSQFINDLSNGTKVSILQVAATEKKSGNVRYANVKIPSNPKRYVSENPSVALNVIPYDIKENIGIDLMTPQERSRLAKETLNFLEIPRKFYSDLRSELKAARDNITERFGFGDTDYNDFIGRDQRFSIGGSVEPSTKEVKILKGFEYSLKALDLLLSSDELFRDTLETRVDSYKNSYDQFITDFDVPQSAMEIVLPDNKSLEDLASQYLGDASRWIEIAIVNNLKSPWIDENSTSRRVKKPGDKILIPKASSTGKSNIPITKTYPISEGLSETERNLGVDIRIDKNFNFVMNNANDFSLIAGGANAAQAVILKMSYEVGSLKYHPQIGVGLAIGEKIRNGEDVRDSIYSSILSDTRFSGINDLTFLQEGGTTNLRFNLSVRELDIPLPVVLTV